MTIHIAPANNAITALCRGRVSISETQALHVRAVAHSANDNTLAPGTFVLSHIETDAQILRAALRHFAQDGLGAARSARARAEAAFFAGDRAAYDWWLAITRTLDRTLAAESERRTNPECQTSDCPRI